jgi:hypothetical protein
MDNEKEFFVISAIPYCLLVLLALASTVHADTGEYNYDISILNSTANYSIGSDMIINAYVSYAGSAVKEYPCIITFYDYADQNKLFSKRIYTDELGQLFYKSLVSDIFVNTQTYSYDIQCSNTTVTGDILITTNTRHTFVPNLINWANQNIDFIIATSAFLFFAGLIVAAATSKK